MAFYMSRPKIVHGRWVAFIGQVLNWMRKVCLRAKPDISDGQKRALIFLHSHLMALRDQ